MIEEAIRDIKAGRFHDPLEGWKNDDLMLCPQTRAYWQDTRPAAFRVLDWPELRKAFIRHEMPAKRGKRLSRDQGLLSVGLAGLGIITLALSPAIANQWAGAVTRTALLLMSLGGALGLLHWPILKSRHVRLGHRFWTERLRQMHFQSMLANLDLVCAAMTDDGKLAELRSARKRWLGDFEREAADPRALMQEVREDRTEAKGWLRAEWRDLRAPAVDGEAMDKQFPADRLDRLALHQMGTANPRNRLHHQHPEQAPMHNTRTTVNPNVRGVPFGRRSPG